MAALVTLVFTESRTTVMPTTSAMPIISAAAVIAVRRGFRAELRLPSMPGTDRLNSIPSTPTIGPLMAGVRTAIPKKHSSTPTTIKVSVEPPAPARPVPSNAPPTAKITAPTIVILVSGRSGVAASRIAAIGAIRAARSAGSSAAIMVIVMPTAYDAMIALAGMASPVICNAPPPTCENT